MSPSTAGAVGLWVVPHAGKGEEISIRVLDNVLYHSMRNGKQRAETKASY